jgi:hypothetical protein
MLTGHLMRTAVLNMNMLSRFGKEYLMNIKCMCHFASVLKMIFNEFVSQGWLELNHGDAKRLTVSMVLSLWCCFS